MSCLFRNLPKQETNRANQCVGTFHLRASNNKGSVRPASSRTHGARQRRIGLVACVVFRQEAFRSLAPSILRMPHVSAAETPSGHRGHFDTLLNLTFMLTDI
jgi:hypothetical protein